MSDMQQDIQGDEWDQPEPTGAKIEDPTDVKAFILAGNAHFTIVSLKTGTRFTYEVRSTPPNADGTLGVVSHFVALLTQPDNERGYSYFGHIFRRDGNFVHGKPEKAKIGEDAEGVRAWRWFWYQVVEGGKSPQEANLEVWHEGRCAACGRRLTVPESIARGLGPECYSRRES